MKAEELVQGVVSHVSGEKTQFFTTDGEVHDRNLTAGASETFSCLRKLSYSKQDAPEDEGFVQEWGFFARGNVIEDWLSKAINASLPEGYRFIKWGEFQETLVLGKLSATPDGILITPDGEYIAVEIKSIDPRFGGTLPKKEHVYQTHIQMGLLTRDNPAHPCTRAIIIYVEASCFSNIRQFDVEYDEALFLRAQERAELAFAHDPSTLPAEGKYLGDCNYCQYTSICGEQILRDVPFGKQDVDEDLADKLDKLFERKISLDTIKRVATFDIGQVTEEIKVLLREQNLQSATTGLYQASYTLTKGRKKLDTEAVSDAGIDLEEFYIHGKPSDTLRVKTLKEKEKV